MAQQQRTRKRQFTPAALSSFKKQTPTIARELAAPRRSPTLHGSAATDLTCCEQITGVASASEDGDGADRCDAAGAEWSLGPAEEWAASVVFQVDEPDCEPLPWQLPPNPQPATLSDAAPPALPAAHCAHPQASRIRRKRTPLFRTASASWPEQVKRLQLSAALVAAPAAAPPPPKQPPPAAAAAHAPLEADDSSPSLARLLSSALAAELLVLRPLLAAELKLEGPSQDLFSTSPRHPACRIPPCSIILAPCVTRALRAQSR